MTKHSVRLIAHFIVSMPNVLYTGFVSAAIPTHVTRRAQRTVRKRFFQATFASVIRKSHRGNE